MQLIGRNRERLVLDALLADAHRGHSGVALVQGDAGIGKSALLHHVLARAEGFRVLRVTPVQSEVEVSFAALHQLCTPLLDGLADLPAPQHDALSSAFGLIAGVAPDRLLIGLGVLSLLSAAAEDEPILCVVDDAQWLDRESAQAIGFVARRLLADRVACVLASRTPLLELDGIPTLAVDPLGEQDARALLASAVPGPIDERVRDRIIAEARGNPLALVEWPRSHTPEELAGGFGVPGGEPVAGQLEAGFRRQLDGLPAPVRRFVLVAAADPTGDVVRVLAAARSLGIEPDAAAPAVDAGLIEVGATLTFRHPLVRSVAYDAATVPDRQAAHRALAAATDPDRDADRRIWHEALGASGPDEALAEALEATARGVHARGGLAAAGALLERAALLTVEPARRARRLRRAATAYMMANCFDRASTMLASADTSSLGDLDRAKIELTRARCVTLQSGSTEGSALMLRAAARLEPLDPRLAKIAYGFAMWSVMGGGRFAEVTMAEVGRATQACMETAPPSDQDPFIGALAVAASQGMSAAAEPFRAALRTVQGEAGPRGVLKWSGYHMTAAAMLWDADAYHEMAVSIVEATREVGAITLLMPVLGFLAHSHLLRGDLDDASDLVSEAERVAVATNSGSEVWPAAMVAGLAGTAGAAATIDAAANAALARRDGLTHHCAQWSRVTLANGQGQYDAAFDAATDAASHHLDGLSHFSLLELVEAAVRTGHGAEARAALDDLRTFTVPAATPWALGTQHWCEALLAEGAEAEEHHRGAIDLLAATPMRPMLARAHLAYGEWLRRQNRRVDARSQLRTAHELFTTMGMEAFAGRAGRELMATGETVRKRTGPSFDELTPQEANIARLAAQGRTNPEIGVQVFLSPRTVEWHLRKVFTKLGISSRHELAERLPRQLEDLPS